MSNRVMAVSATPDYKLLLDKGRAQEKKYDWVAATELYKRASIVALKSNDFPKAAEVYERIGFCYHRAAMQAKNPQEFRSRMVLASDAYSQAARLFEKVVRLDRLAKICHCEAIAAYVGSWLKPDFASRKRLLDESCEREKEAVEFCRKMGDRFTLGKTYNDLSMRLIDQLNLEWDKQMRLETLKEALDYGEKAIDILSELGEDYEVARAYCTASIHHETAAKGMELEKRTKHEQKALTYSRKAVELSKKISDLFLLGVSSICLGTAVADFTGRPDAAAKHFENALKFGMVTRDRYLIGRASYLLAFLTAWKMVAEEDPEKIREESERCEKHSKDAIHHFNSISYDQEIASGFYCRAENYNILAMSTETGLERKRSLLMKSIKSARNGLEHARRSGSIKATWFILHPLSKSLFYLSTLETDIDAKKRLLEESLRHRKENIKALQQAMPYYFWNHGVYHNYLARIQAELAEIERNREQKVYLLEDATKSAENCIALCLRHGALNRGQYAVLGGYYSDLGRILNQLYLLVRTPELLSKLLRVFEGAAGAYKKADLPSRTAEAHWQIATLYNRSGEYLKAAENFRSASEDYRIVAEKVTPLSEFYLSHALYMQTWEEIEKGRHYHDIEEYAQSKVHYQKVANLYETSKSWAYLAPNYSAWAQLENGEALSRKERSKQAIEAFQEAARLFIQAKQSLEEAIPGIQSMNEKNKANELCKASDVRREYCLGRILLEEGRILNREGDIRQSAEKYGLAAKVFQKVTEATATESERNELLTIVYTCQGWEKMNAAERKVSAELFLQSSELFQKAKEHSSKESTSLLALGNSAFCRAQEAAMKFEVTRDLAFYSTAKQNMESSAHYYLKAGFEEASECVNASEALLDAYLYMSTAETETVYEKKVQMYQLAEKYLERAVELYGKAGYRGKRDEALRILTKAKEKREFALSLGEALKAPHAASSTAVISVPTSTQEEAVGLEKFEHANIQAYLDAPKEVVAGEIFEVRLDMANVAKELGLLVRIENLIPSNFELTETVPALEFENGIAIMKGKRLEQQKVESIRIRVSTLQSGICHLSPRIVYVDEAGKFNVCQPDPVAIAIYPAGRFQFETSNAQKVFEYLIKAFVEDYMKRRLPVERSGWRTLMQIVRNAKTSKLSIYGTTTHRGTAMTELQSRGVVEVRIFTGERGRGGKITKARVSYEKDIIKRYIDQQVMKIKEK